MISNIERLMSWRGHNDRVFTVQDLAESYPITPKGTQTNYGIVETNVERFRVTGRALQAEHRVVVDSVMAALFAGYADELTFQLVVEPNQQPSPYRYVLAHLDLLESLAQELKERQAEANALGKILHLILRFGSEMNDVGGSSYAQDPLEYIQAFRQVRALFRRHSSDALFPFSPALRADIDVQAIGCYWPGDDYVDLCGATWFVHGEAQRERGFSNMANHYLAMRGKNLPFSLDEFGGAMGSGEVYNQNDQMIQLMLSQIAGLATDGVAFKYGMLFLDEGKYGFDATLGFLK